MFDSADVPVSKFASSAATIDVLPASEGDIQLDVSSLRGLREALACAQAAPAMTPSIVHLYTQLGEEKAVTDGTAAAASILKAALDAEAMQPAASDAYFSANSAATCSQAISDQGSEGGSALHQASFHSTQNPAPAADDEWDSAGGSGGGAADFGGDDGDGGGPDVSDSWHNAGEGGGFGGGGGEFDGGGGSDSEGGTGGASHMHSTGFGAGEADSDSSEHENSRAGTLDLDALQQLANGGSNREGSSGSGQMTTKGGGWAGASFWRYRAVSCAAAAKSGAAAVVKKTSTRKPPEPPLWPPDHPYATDQTTLGTWTLTTPGTLTTPKKEDIIVDFTGPKIDPRMDPNFGKDIQLRSRAVVVTMLPEDLHYQRSRFFNRFLATTSLVGTALESGSSLRGGEAGSMVSTVAGGGGGSSSTDVLSVWRSHAAHDASLRERQVRRRASLARNAAQAGDGGFGAGDGGGEGADQDGGGLGFDGGYADGGYDEDDSDGDVGGAGADAAHGWDEEAGSGFDPGFGGLAGMLGEEGDSSVYEQLLGGSGFQLPKPRLVQRLEVNYERSAKSSLEVNYDLNAKQVDVRALKETLHTSMKQLLASDNSPSEAIDPSQEKPLEALSFKQVIKSLPEHSAAGPAADISTHLCFICLLHLANENGLRLTNEGSMDTLNIYTQ
eukprot:gene19938-26645_t